MKPLDPPAPEPPPLALAVIGAGITGLSAAWLLSRRHHVTLFEKETRLGGHSHTVKVRLCGRDVTVDTGFIVYNEATYPNLTALFAALSVTTQPAPMSFGVSLSRGGGTIEYSSASVGAFLGGGRNLLSPRFWAMSLDILRFYRAASRALKPVEEGMTLGAYLDANGYSRAFQEDHLLPEAAAIWSCSAASMRAYPLTAFIGFFQNHGLLKLAGRPPWRSVVGGSGAYVQALSDDMNVTHESGDAVVAVRPVDGGVEVRQRGGATRRFDRVLIASHADQARELLPPDDAAPRTLLAQIPYAPNRAILHTDASLMPSRRQAWASWNVVGDRSAGCAVTYWMNKLQSLETSAPLFVSLNPLRAPRPETILWEGQYEHPCFTPAGLAAQRRLWAVQGRDGIWLAGAWCGAGFHEDGLQAGLAAAEQMGGVKRPWRVADESGRIFLTAQDMASA